MSISVRESPAEPRIGSFSERVNPCVTAGSREILETPWRGL
jgi:hypothetical protein